MRSAAMERKRRKYSTPAVARLSPLSLYDSANMALTKTTRRTAEWKKALMRYRACTFRKWVCSFSWKGAALPFASMGRNNQRENSVEFPTHAAKKYRDARDAAPGTVHIPAQTLLR
jgi:hypothetical protein